MLSCCHFRVSESNIRDHVYFLSFQGSILCKVSVIAYGDWILLCVLDEFAFSFFNLCMQEFFEFI
jgi:hypothetical protein